MNNRYDRNEQDEIIRMRIYELREEIHKLEDVPWELDEETIAQIGEREEEIEDLEFELQTLDTIEYEELDEDEDEHNQPTNGEE